MCGAEACLTWVAWCAGGCRHSCSSCSNRRVHPGAAAGRSASSAQAAAAPASRACGCRTTTGLVGPAAGTLHHAHALQHSEEYHPLKCAELLHRVQTPASSPRMPLGADWSELRVHTGRPPAAAASTCRTELQLRAQAALQPGGRAALSLLRTPRMLSTLASPAARATTATALGMRVCPGSASWSSSKPRRKSLVDEM